jgi:hypothetical protein
VVARGDPPGHRRAPGYALPHDAAGRGGARAHRPVHGREVRCGDAGEGQDVVDGHGWHAVHNVAAGAGDSPRESVAG